MPIDPVRDCWMY